MSYTDEERLGSLPRQGAPALVHYRTGDEYRDLRVARVERLLHRKDGRLREQE